MEQEYLESLKNSSRYSSDICDHNPKCLHILGMYFCRQDYETAKLILKHYKLETVYPSIKSELGIKNPNI